MNNPPVLRLTEIDYVLLIRSITKEISSCMIEITLNKHAANNNQYYLIEKNSAELFGDMMRLIEMKNAMRAMVEPIKLAQHGLQ